jgi:hypothetical protein
MRQEARTKMGQLDQYPLRIQRAEGREISEAEIEGEEGEMDG